MLGAKCVGEKLVAGKIDRLAVTIAEGIPVKWLALLDTCYSPTLGAGYEVVTMALDELIGKLDGG